MFGPFSQMPRGLQGLINLDSNGNLNANISSISGSFGSFFSRVTANMNLNLNSIFKPNGKQSGNSESKDENGKQYPKGFTPPVDYYKNPTNTGPSGYPIEYGYSMISNGSLINSKGKLSVTNGRGFIDINNLILTSTQPYGIDRKINTNSESTISQYDKRKFRYKTYESFKDLSSKMFTHLLDYYIDSNGKSSIDRLPDISDISSPETLKDIYLGSFIRTSDDNEDPTYLTYDIIIKYSQSPILNGEIDKFINLMSSLGNTEIGSRLGVLDKFRSQLYKFLKVNSSVVGAPDFLVGSDTNDIMSNSGVKTYYLKNLSGLDNLNEQNTSEKTKSFVNYGSDFLTLGFYEDVSQNIGYLASLYKSLYWSRRNGKHIMPENLLRFDMDITITEMRKFNRVISNTDRSFDVYPDIISKYVYSLYECQFYFDKMPHGDALDLSSPKMVDNVDIKINYKYTTLKFEKYKNPDEELTSIDNNKIDLNKISSIDTNNSLINKYNTIENNNKTINNKKYDTYSQGNQGNGQSGTDNDGVGGLKNKSKTSGPNSTSESTSIFNNIRGSIGVDIGYDQIQAKINGAISNNQVSAQVSAQALLLDKTLQKIRNSSPTKISSLDKLTTNSVTSRVDRIKQQPSMRARSLEDIINRNTGELKF